MLGILLKKEIKMILNAITPNSNKNKNTSKAAIIAMTILWAIVGLSLAAAFLGISHLLGDVLIPLGFDWLYFALIFTIGFTFSLIGNAFITQGIVFKAKDNDLLLAMPIKEISILASRSIVIFALGLLFTLIYAVPCFAIYISIKGSFFINAKVIFAFIIMVIMEGLLVTALSNVFGYIFSIIGNRVKNKSLFTTIFIFIVLGIYYYFNFNMNKYLTMLVENSLVIGEKIKTSVFGWPVFCVGNALTGNLQYLLYFSLISLAVSALIFYILKKTFIKVITKEEKIAVSNKACVKESSFKQKSIKSSLLNKEFKKFLSSPAYMLNSGMTIVIMLFGSVVLLVKSGSFEEVLAPIYANVPIIKELMILIFAGVIWMLDSMAAITAPSISLEGKNFWILKSLPVNVSDIFYSKIMLELLMGIPSLTVLSGTLIYCFKIEKSEALILLFAVYVFQLFHSVFGLALGIKFPKLDYPNDSYVVKQSMPSTISIFSGWFFVIFFGLIYYFGLKNLIVPKTYLLIVSIIVFAITFACNIWIGKCGKKMFDEI